MKKLTPSMAVAITALLVALSGGAIAASTLVPRNSVGSAQIINHSVKKVDLGTPLPRGPRGAQGPQGAQGAPGAVGIATVGTATAPAASMCANGGGACQVAGSTATCPTGSVVVGGGYQSSSVDLVVSYSQRVTGTTYGVIGINYTAIAETISAQAICAVGPGATTASSDGMQAVFEHALSDTRAEVAK
jgi:hypothetical protein